MPGGTLVLDSEGLSGWLAGNRNIARLLAAAQEEAMDVVTSAMTILEASHGKTDGRRLDWALSRVRVEPVTATSARAAAATPRHRLSGDQAAGLSRFGSTRTSRGSTSPARSGLNRRSIAVHSVRDEG